MFQISTSEAASTWYLLKNEENLAIQYAGPCLDLSYPSSLRILDNKNSIIEMTTPAVTKALGSSNTNKRRDRKQKREDSSNETGMDPEQTIGRRKPLQVCRSGHWYTRQWYV
jgi:hypothetical protein